MARRSAIKKVSGDFCLFLDSDDYWDAGLLEIINKAINSHDCEMVIFKYKKVTEKGDYIADSDYIFEDNSVFNIKDKDQLFMKILNSFSLNNLVTKA